ncbi:hypothetical protein ACF061_28220 [Streptomyces sp. NPDC015220]|uniref:hypothetical protein n=1 Tax=Streptomyces sp. NPDC015220 TaxID=3364947 RepID=UPI0036FF6C70
MFSEKISTPVRVRPRFEAPLALALQIKAHAPHCRVIFTVYEMYDPSGRGRLLFAFFAAMRLMLNSSARV